MARDRRRRIILRSIIIRNVAQCNRCKDVIESKTRHDFVSCKCGAIFIDGGKDYFRRCGDPADFIEMNEIDKELYDTD